MYYINTLISFITHHHGIAYGTIFLISLSESLALVGLLVPGTLIMFGVGAIVATGSLKLLPVLLMAMIGAVAGDGISYWLGHYHKERLVNIWPFSRYPGMLKKGEVFFHRHGGKSILLGRFIGPIRPVIPMVAGMLGMCPVRFTVVNVLSAIGWALVYILPGVIFGASLAVAGTVSTRLAVLILVLVAGIWSLIWICRKTVYFFESTGPKRLSALKQWVTTETPHQGLPVRSIKGFLSFLIFSEQGEELLFAILALVFFIAGLGFLGVLQDVIAKDSLMASDQAVYHFLQSLRTPWMDNIFVAVTELGDSFVNIALACMVLLILFVKRCYRAAVFWFFVITGELLTVQLLKWLIHLPRPIDIYNGVSIYGFPSGHTTMSVVLYGFLAIIMVRQVLGYWRWVLFSTVVLIAFAIGFSRVYLGVHWLSDVLGGYCIGVSWATFFGFAYLKRQNKTIPQHLLIIAVLAVVIIAGGWHVNRQHKKDIMSYAPRQEIQIVPLSLWLANRWQTLPVYRIDLAGEREQPLTIQWSGSTDVLERYLLSKKWQKPAPLKPKDFLKILSSDTPVEELPVLPRLHDGRIDVLRLVQAINDTHRFVLRLWPTYIKTLENNSLIFEGTIEIQNRRHIADMFLIATDSKKYGSPLDKMKAELFGQFSVKLVNRKEKEIIFENKDHRLKWHGEVLLIYNLARKGTTNFNEED